jgi:hypothetical protein
LYIHVATSTVLEPRTKAGVIRKSNKQTEAKNDKIMERLVANAFRILSEYLMTSAVTSPPQTCVNTVAHAHKPKWSSIPKIEEGLRIIGANAGMIENRESWVFRTQRSALDPLRTISK